MLTRGKLKRSTLEGASIDELGLVYPQDGVESARGLRVYSLSMALTELETIQISADVGPPCNWLLLQNQVC